jgi:general stress protein YciG
MATNDQGNKQGGKSGSQQSGDTSKRGFASMDPEQQREIAAEGGRAAHEKGTAHEFTSEEARRAGSMSHKNDPGRSSQSATSGSGSRSTASGNKGSAKPDQEDAEEGGDSGGSSGASGSQSGGSSPRSKS